jgi:hypothetical protein
VREAAALVAGAYIVCFLLARAWAGRRRGHLTVVCPLRSGAAPVDIVDRLGEPVPAGGLDRFLPADFTIAYATDAPGISLATIEDETALDRKLGPYVSPPIFAPSRERLLACVGGEKWTPGVLYALVLEVLHRDRPRSLLVDLRPPSKDTALGRRVSTSESDADLALYAYELRCRLRRYSRYRDAEFRLLLEGEKGATWLLTG